MSKHTQKSRSVIIIIIIFTCGSFGSGVQSRDWTESNVEDIVRTGDHCCLRISKQMTPYKIRYESALGGLVAVRSF